MDNGRFISFIQRLKDSSKNKKIFSIETLYSISCEENYSVFAAMVNKLVEEKFIVAYGGKKKFSMTPILNKKYKVLYEEENEYISFINNLYPLLNRKYYLKNRDDVHNDFIYIKKLDKYLKKYFDVEKLPIMTVNERSYEIFGDEKFLTSTIGRTIVVTRLGFSIDKLNVMITREPYFDYYRGLKERNNMIIIENKDTWYSFKEIMKRYGTLKIEGTEFSIAVYGEGKKIEQSFEYIYEKPYLNKIDEIYYAGDIDREGIGIYNRLKQRYLDFKIKIFIPLYKMSIARSLNGETREASEKQGKVNSDYFLSHFNKKEKVYIEAVLDKNHIIPQESINYQDLLTLVKE